MLSRRDEIDFGAAHVQLQAPSAQRVAYSVNGAAAMLSVGRGTIYALFDTGDLRPLKIGRRTIVTHAELERFVTRRMIQTHGRR